VDSEHGAVDYKALVQVALQHNNQRERETSTDYSNLDECLLESSIDREGVGESDIQRDGLDQSSNYNLDTKR
jgi:hypothetical protein